MNKLSKRLKTIYMLVDKEIIADVGCDHGKLAYELLKNNIVKKAYVSDISKSSLQKAIDILSEENFNFRAICCDGLTKYNDAMVDQCIISGMGGEEIIKIIKNSPININSYILSPQHNVMNVKNFMLGLDYTISFDIIIKDKNKFYHIIKFDKSANCLDNNELYLNFGKDSFDNNLSDLDLYIEAELKKNTNLLKCVNSDKLQEIKDKIDLLNKAKKELNKNE